MMTGGKAKQSTGNTVARPETIICTDYYSNFYLFSAHGLVSNSTLLCLCCLSVHFFLLPNILRRLSASWSSTVHLPPPL